MRIVRVDDGAVPEETRAWLGDYNAQFAAWDRESVQLLAHADDGELVGALGATMYWGKLRVDRLAVHPDRRGQGIGTALMHHVEGIARDAGCSGVYLDTMSFQALDFYLALGYEPFGELDGFAGESTRHYVHKPIRSDRRPS
jgi:GNAT superfamily N-acetyltransferase